MALGLMWGRTSQQRKHDGKELLTSWKPRNTGEYEQGTWGEIPHSKACLLATYFLRLLVPMILQALNNNIKLWLCGLLRLLGANHFLKASPGGKQGRGLQTTTAVTWLPLSLPIHPEAPLMSAVILPILSVSHLCSLHQLSCPHTCYFSQRIVFPRFKFLS